MLLYFLIFVLPVIALVSLILYLPWLLTHRKGFSYHLVRYGLLGYGLSLLYLTVLLYYPDITFQPEYYFYNLRPFVWLTQVYDMGVKKMVEQLVLNVGMFVPLGLLLPLVFRKMRTFLPTALGVLATTLSIEVFQFFIGRSADIDDVIMNLLGGIIGYGLFRLLDKLFRNKSWWHQLLTY